MLYHYTSLYALKSILKDAASKGTMCFWATRYDCFADEAEYRLGVETVNRLLPVIEKELPKDRQIAEELTWNMVSGNENLPYPYIVSFTARHDNEYMWSSYAKDESLAFEIDESLITPSSTLILESIKPCIYTGLVTDDYLIDQIQKGYGTAGMAFLSGPMKNEAFTMLRDNPQVFVRLMGMCLLSFTATRIKGEEYQKEEETRVIISTSVPGIEDFVIAYREMIQNSLHLDCDELINVLRGEKSRLRGEKTVYYRDYYMLIGCLKSVYTHSGNQDKVIQTLKELGLGNIPVRSI